MPEFGPSEMKIATVPIKVSPADIVCGAELYIGPNEMTKIATSNLVMFASTGSQQDIDMQIIMPSQEGSYHVYIDIYTADCLVGAYQSFEDVVIVLELQEEVEEVTDVEEPTGIVHEPTGIVYVPGGIG